MCVCVSFYYNRRVFRFTQNPSSACLAAKLTMRKRCSLSRITVIYELAFYALPYIRFAGLTHQPPHSSLLHKNTHTFRSCSCSDSHLIVIYCTFCTEIKYPKKRRTVSFPWQFIGNFSLSLSLLRLCLLAVLLFFYWIVKFWDKPCKPNTQNRKQRVDKSCALVFSFFFIQKAERWKMRRNFKESAQPTN